MIYQDTLDSFDWITIFTPALSVFILFFLLVLMLIIHWKIRNWLFELIIFLFSIIIGLISMSNGNIPFTPYLQLFFIILQAFIFIQTTIEVRSD